MKNPALKLVALLLTVFAFAFVAQAGGVTNNFDTSYDYFANGVIGDTNWDGVYLGFGDVPTGGAGGAGNGATTIANANVSFGSFLTIGRPRGDWAGAGDDGFLPVEACVRRF